MSDVIYKLFGQAVAGATSDSLATVDIQDDGFIEGVLLNVAPRDADALGDQLAMEISFSSSNTFTNNDVRSSIALIGTRQAFLTSGGGPSNGTIFLSFMKGIPLTAGERIHMHVVASAGVTGECTAYLYTVTDRGSRRTTRRRR